MKSEKSLVIKTIKQRLPIVHIGIVSVWFLINKIYERERNKNKIMIKIVFTINV